jgi:hypothetical protein
MLHAGHAVVYEQKGAEYGDIGLEPYRTAEAKAKFVFVFLLRVTSPERLIHLFYQG